MRKSGKREMPPQLELECLKALWELGPAPVKNVREVVTRDRELAYTTVMTILERLARKGLVSRQKEARSFVYAPVVTREHLCEVALRQLLDNFFAGSAEKLIEYVGRVPARPPASLAAAVAAGRESSDVLSPLDPSLL